MSQSEPVCVFLTPQVFRDERMGFYDAERTMFFKKALPACLLPYVVAFPFVFVVINYILWRVAALGWFVSFLLTVSCHCLS